VKDLRALVLSIIISSPIKLQDHDEDEMNVRVKFPCKTYSILSICL